MNLILFEPHEITAPLPRTDRRAAHILEVLGRKPGDSFDVGLVNGPRGKATLETVSADALTLRFSWGAPPSPVSDPIVLVVGLPRPQTARDILRDATTLGAAEIHFVHTEKSDRNYAQSTLWRSGEWRRHLVAGAEQAFDTRLPEVTFSRSLPEVLLSLPATAARIALDNYEANVGLADVVLAPNPAGTVLALGGERGWSARDREALSGQGFTLVHLGSRVLRTEIAVVAALTLVRAKLGLL